MKKLFIIAALAVVSSIVDAALPNYQTFGPAYGNAAAGASLIIPADPVLTPRIVTVNWNSDSNTAALNCSSGGTAFFITYTNLVESSVTQVINSTNGLPATGTLVLQKQNNVCYSAAIASYSNTGGSNVVTLASGGWGVATSVGDSVYAMQTAVSLPIGATTNYQSGDAIYVGNAARPVLMQLTPAFATNRLNSVIARYE